MKPNKPPGTRLIRNSIAELLIFTAQAGEQSIGARYEDETAWLFQKLVARLFDVDVRANSRHLRDIFASGDLVKGSVVRNHRTTAVVRKTYHAGSYNLDVCRNLSRRRLTLPETRQESRQTVGLTPEGPTGARESRRTNQRSDIEGRRLVSRARHPVGSDGRIAEPPEPRGLDRP